MRCVCGTRFLGAFGAAFVLFASVMQANAQCELRGGAGGTRLIDFLQGTGNSVAASITAMNTAFQTQTSAFLSSPAATRPDEFASGAWIRGVGGRLDVDTQNNSNFIRPPSSIIPGTFPVTCPSLRTTSDFTGVQGGYDFGRLNLGASSWSIHGGITGGYFESTTKGAGTSTAHVPFVGLYAALVRGSFFVDAQVRGDFYSLDASDPSLGAQGSTNAKGISVISSVGYNWAIGNYFVEPSAGLVYSKTRIDPLTLSATVVGPPGSRTIPSVLNLDDISTLLGRIGIRVGTVFSVGEVTLQPFVAASLWREGAGSNNMTASFAIPSNAPATGEIGFLNTNSSRIGYFGQYSVGFSASVPNSNWLGYARMDYRNGQNIEGLSVNGGLRYQFAPPPRLATAAAPMPVKAPPLAPIPSWTGFYVGAFLGGAWSAGDATATELAPVFNGVGSFSTYGLGSTVIGGVTAGYNRQFGNLVAGLETEGGYLRLKGSAPFTPEVVETVSSTKIGDWYALLAGRFGVNVGPLLLYAKAGGAIINETSDVVSAPCFVRMCGSVNATGNNSLRPAWVAGGGLEYALNNSWSIKGEYLFFGTDRSYNVSGVGSPSPAGPPPARVPPPTTFNWHQSVPETNTVKFGINYKFAAGST